MGGKNERYYREHEAELDHFALCLPMLQLFLRLLCSQEVNSTLLYFVKLTGNLISIS